jgi:hypothetical protein
MSYTLAEALRTKRLTTSYLKNFASFAPLRELKGSIVSALPAPLREFVHSILI